MRRPVVMVVATLAIALSCFSVSQASVTEDGAWWKQLPRHDRLRAVEAEIDGIYNGWWLAFTTYDEKVEFIVLDEMNSNKGHVDDKLRFDREVSEAYQKQKNAPPKFTKPFKYYINALDDFYAKHPEANNVLVGAVMQCLSDKPWMSCDKIAKEFSKTGPLNEQK